MSNLMPCWTDSDMYSPSRLLPGEAPEAVEEESPLTPMEQRIEWICSEWADALREDTFDTWRDVRMMIYAALQTLVYSRDRHADIAALRELGKFADMNGIDCIGRGKYEGAAA